MKFTISIREVQVGGWGVFKIYFFRLIQNYYSTMKLDSARSHGDSDSSESYGHQIRLRYRKQFNGWNKEQKSRRISQSKKERLVTMVTKENYRIKEAGRLLGISYSTAKKIFTNFRIQLRAKKECDTGDQEKHMTCHYIELPEFTSPLTQQIQLVSSIAGQAQTSLSLRKLFNKE